MDIRTFTTTQLGTALGTLTAPNTRKISDYLAGRQLGPLSNITIQGIASEAVQRRLEADVGYWGGDLLATSHPKYSTQVLALKKSFSFRNVTLEGVEMLADGVGADEPDWSFTLTRPLADGETPTEEELALIAELESVLTPWWDERDLPTLGQTALILGIAHGRQPARFRIPDRFKEQDGRLKPKPAEQSLDGLFLELPELVDSGLITDKRTLERYGLTRIEYANAQNGYEMTYLNDDGGTVLATIQPNGDTALGTLDLGGLLWLHELKFRRGVVTDDVLSIQTARNVATTNLTRNTRWASFEKTIGIGIDPPVDENGKIIPLSGAGAESYLQPTVQTEVEETGARDSAGQPVKIVREKMYANASMTKLDPSDPKAITAAIERADEDLYSIMRQRFMLTAASDASGRKSEVSAGPFLRATARYATGMEAFYRGILLFAARISALVQGQPGKYDGLRPVVSCHQQVFEPSPEMVTAYLALQEAGAWSMQTVRTATGRSDPDAEQQQIDKERAAADLTTDPDKPPESGDPPGTPPVT